MRAHVLDPMLAGHRFEVPPDRQPRRSVAHLGVWTTFAVVAILLMDVLNLTAYGVVIPVAGALLALVMARIGPPKPSIAWTKLVVDRADVIAIAALYVVTVGLFRLAFGVFGTDRVAGLFLSFAAALLIGVAGSVVYTTWIRRRPLASIGIGPQNLRSTLRLGLLLAAVQFSITLWGYDLPEPVDWVPLLIMAITVGLFEAIFFRGFIQGRLEASFGAAPAVLGAAALYALYHVGYGMDAHQMVFLFGLGVVYAIAYRLTENVLVLWPLLIPMGSLYAQLDSGDLVGELPLASIAGFGDVLVVMAIVVWLAHRSERRRRIPRLRPARAGVTAGQRSRAMSLPTDGDIGAGGSSRTTDRTGVSLSGPEGRGGVSGPAFSATPLALPQHADECPSSQSIKRSASIADPERGVSERALAPVLVRAIHTCLAAFGRGAYARRVSRSAVRHERAVLVVAIAILPWVALSRIGEWRSASAPSSPKTSDAIDSLTSRVVAASDRVTFSFQAKRADGKRHVSTIPPSRIGTSTPLFLAWNVWPSSSIARSKAIALRLACRGPPPLAI